MDSHRAVLVLSGYNIRAVVAFCRWAKAHHVPFHLIARSSADPILLTEYARNVAVTRNSPALTLEIFLSWVQKLRDRHGIDRLMVLPTSEFLNRFMLAHTASIEGAGCTVPLVSPDLYTMISDKESFTRLCGAYGLDVPSELPEMPERPPFVAKPRTYTNSTGKQLAPYLILHRAELDSFLRDEDPGSYFYQQFVDGRSHYLLAYIRRSGEDVVYSQENLMQQARGKSIILAKGSDFHHTGVAQRYLELLHDLGFFGLVMIEVRQDSASGRYFMIEANPRLWGPMQYVIDNDIDLFGALLEESGFEVLHPEREPRLVEYYFWSGGIKERAKPIAFFNYSSDQFVADLPALRRQDIFCRKDTVDLFLKEAETTVTHEC